MDTELPLFCPSFYYFQRLFNVVWVRAEKFDIVRERKDRNCGAFQIYRGKKVFNVQYENKGTQNWPLWNAAFNFTWVWILSINDCPLCPAIEMFFDPMYNTGVNFEVI